MSSNSTNYAICIKYEPDLGAEGASRIPLVVLPVKVGLMSTTIKSETIVTSMIIVIILIKS